MIVQAIKSEPRCKLCASPERERIDVLLLRRSMREKTEDGTPINLPYVLSALADLGVQNPTAENVKMHFKKHCEVRTEQEHVQRVEASTSALDTILANPESFVDVDAGLKALFSQGVAELRARAEARGEIGITVDQLVKIADTLSKRSTSDAQSELLRSLTGGIQLALGGGAAALSGRDVLELDAGDVEEAELVS